MKLSVLGMRARLRRVELKLETRAVADEAFIDEAGLIVAEEGDLTVLDLDAVDRLARVLKCRPAWLLGFDDGHPAKAPGEDEQRSLTVSMDGIKSARIEEWAAELVAEKLVARVCTDAASALTRELKERITAAVDREIERVVPAAVEVAMKHTVASRLRALFDRETGDYSRRRKYIDTLAEQVMEAWVKKELAEEVVAARKRFAEAIDTVLRAKLVDTLRGALGL